MGNILTQERHLRDGTQIEDLTYRYRYDNNNKLLRNRLYHINDNIASNVDSTDIDDQGVFNNDPSFIETANNYVRDKMGRLVKDRQEEIDTVIWTASNKVKEIRRTFASNKKNVIFDYDAMGNQIAKHVYNNQSLMLEQSTYYILDAQGNQLSIYEHSIDSTSGSVYYYLTDRNIYGSSRLGVTRDTLNMFNPSVLQSYGVLGNRNYELTDHRGNVQTVINDIKYPLSSDNTSIDSYEVGISSVADYSPFGVQLDGRTIDNVFYHNIESQYEEILVFEDDFEVVSDWEEMTVDTEITYPSGAMRVKNTDSISRRFIGTKHNFIVENGDHTLSFEVKHFPFSVCLAPPIELNDLDNENGENTEVQRPDRMMYLIYIVKSPNNDEILKDSVSATGLYSNITFTPTESGSYTIEFFIRNACNISYFELDNVKITRNGDEIQNLFVANRYRYSFQNQEHHDEIRGKGNYINYKYRGHDPRVGRLDWLVDPLAPDYPWNSPYAFSENNVIHAVELEGLEKFEIFKSGEYLILNLIDVTSDLEIINRVDPNNITTHKNFVYRGFKEEVGEFSADKWTGDFTANNITYRNLNSRPGNPITPEYVVHITDATLLEKRPIAGKGLYTSGFRTVEEAFSTYEISEPLFNNQGDIIRDKIIPDNFDYVNIYIDESIYTKQEALEALGRRINITEKEVIFRDTPFNDNDEPDPTGESSITIGFGRYE